MRQPFSRLLPSVIMLALVLGVASAAPRADAAGEALAAVEAEFRASIKRLTPATVVVTPRGIRGRRAGFSSGVIVSKDGLVLSDGDAGMVFRMRDGKRVRERIAEVDVRVPQPKTGTFRTFRARVLFRSTDVDTSLIKIMNAPTKGFPFVPPGHSDELRVGDFAFAVGSQTYESGGTQPSLTAGVVAALDAADPSAKHGRFEFIYVSAAVNEGVNGGPLVDLDGRLVGTISTYMKPEPDEAFQFLGKVIPMDRIRAAMVGVAEARRLFSQPVPDAETSTPAHDLETVFGAAALAAHPSVVSIDIKRKEPVSGAAPLGQKSTDVARYQGAVSGIMVSDDGYVVTNLYNVTNVALYAEPFWDLPPAAKPEVGVAAVEGATVHLAGGGSATAELVGVDHRFGVALFKADADALKESGELDALPVLPPAPAAAFQRGRFVLALGNPFGSKQHEAPLLTLGILSKQHPERAAAPWRGQWQTDAAGLDTNAGGAVVDMEGRIVGMLSLWLPAKHGRNSGIAFVVPYDRLMESVGYLQAGKTREAGFLGIRFAKGVAPRLEGIEDDTGAATAGLEAGDLITEIDGHPAKTIIDAVSVIRHRTAGETVHVRYERDGESYETDITLGVRPKDE